MVGSGARIGVTGRRLLGAGLLALASFLALTAAVTDARFDRLDASVRSAVYEARDPRLLGFMAGASWLGGQSGQVAVVILGAAVLWQKRRRWSLALPLLMAGMGLFQHSAKWAIDRPRPNLDPLGFPSAHVMSLVVLCGTLAYLLGGRVSRPGRWVAAGGAATVVAVVGYSRMYLDMHWLSDLLGGLTAGLAVLLLGVWLIEAVPSPARLRGRGWPGLGAAVLAPAVSPLAVAERSIPAPVAATPMVAAAEAP